MDAFEQFFGQLQAIQGREYVIEFGQDEGRKKSRYETMLLLPASFDPTKPFMFRLTSNDQEQKVGYGYSDMNKAMGKKK